MRTSPTSSELATPAPVCRFCCPLGLASLFRNNNGQYFQRHVIPGYSKYRLEASLARKRCHGFKIVVTNMLIFFEYKDARLILQY